MFPILVLLFGGSGVVGSVNIFNTTVHKTQAGSAEADYNLLSSGLGSGTGISGWTWLLTGLNSYFQVRATLVSGSTPNAGDSLGSWLSLNTSRSWGLSDTVSNSCSILVEIKRIADGAIVGSATVNINVTVF